MADNSSRIEKEQKSKRYRNPKSSQNCNKHAAPVASTPTTPHSSNGRIAPNQKDQGRRVAIKEIRHSQTLKTTNLKKT